MPYANVQRSKEHISLNILKGISTDPLRIILDEYPSQSEIG
jgi:hypothetical protein